MYVVDDRSCLRPNSQRRYWGHDRLNMTEQASGYPAERACDICLAGTVPQVALIEL